MKKIMTEKRRCSMQLKSEDTLYLLERKLDEHDRPSFTIEEETQGQ